MTYAMTSFPDEVELCTSSIPGCLYGVAAKRPLPRGTVVGPYEGRRTFHLNEGEKNHEYVWEVEAVFFNVCISMHARLIRWNLHKR